MGGGGQTLKKEQPERRRSSSARHAAVLQEEETQRGLSQEAGVSAVPGKNSRSLVSVLVLLLIFLIHNITYQTCISTVWTIIFSFTSGV